MMRKRSVPVLFGAAIALMSANAGPAWAAHSFVPFKEARIYIEFNQTANDLGYHVSLDAEDWTRLAIVNPRKRLVFEVEGRGPYRQLGMTELFFEGAEPNLDEFPLDDLLALFPEGAYTFVGRTVDRRTLVSTSTLSHAVPNGPGNVTALLGTSDSLVISWDAVTTVPVGFPDRPISIVSYQLIVKPFQVTVPATVTSVTVPPEFVSSLPAGENLFEVLAIDASGNQSITESSFVKP
jgi:hypothetical protein